MTTRIEIDLPGLPESANARLHWRRRAAINKRWNHLTQLSLIGKVPPEPLRAVAIELTRYSSAPADPDNIVSSCKPILDGLVAAGVIADDGPNIVRHLVPRWERAPRYKGHVRVVVIPVEPPHSLECT